jgi:hypothetical protein
MSSLIQKLYPGEFPRPSVEAEDYEGQGVLIAGTPWGTKDALKELNDMTREYFSASIADGEATSPFARLPGLSRSGNTLRIATMLANESVFQKFNREAYTTGCEALVMAFDRNELSWIQIGQPHLLLLRGNEIQPLSVAHDLSLDFEIATPLPTKLLGVERSVELETKSLALKDGDRLLMIARTALPKALFVVEPATMNSAKLLDAVFNAMAKSDARTPFWVGIFEI